MDETFIQKSIGLIASGLIKKEKQLDNTETRYPLVTELNHGINMFLYASIEMGKANQEIFEYANEASFFEEFLTKPISHWFSLWDKTIVEKLCIAEKPYYHYGAFAIKDPLRNRYYPTDDCHYFLDTQDSDLLAGTDEKLFYEKIKLLDQEKYSLVRNFIIRNPIIDPTKKSNILVKVSNDPIARDAIQFAYEEFVYDGWQCPICGWTMTKDKYGPICISPDCTKTTPILTDDICVNGSMKTTFRLKKGIMKYISWPGKLETEIEDFCKPFCEKNVLSYTMWPYMDKYDVEIRFKNGDIWEIDAKCYHNPYALRSKIEEDNGFPTGEFTKGFFVIPDQYLLEYANYTDIINKLLNKLNQRNVRCIGYKDLQRKIKNEVKSLNGK